MRKRAVLAAMTALALLTHVEAEAALCVVSPQKVALTDDYGAELLAGDGVDALFTVREGALYAAGVEGAYRLYDEGGEPVGDTVFGMIRDAGDALVFRDGSLYGVMSLSGEVLLPAAWTGLVEDGEGGWLALDSDPLDDLPDELIHLDEAGVARRTGVYTASGLAPVESGRMPYMDPNGRWGAVDARGEAAIDADWRALGPFRYGVAQVSGPRGFGLIDLSGEAVLEPVWDWLDRNEIMLAARNGGGVEVFAPDGSRSLFAITGEGLEAALAGKYLWVSDDRGARLYGADGGLICEGAPGTVFAQGEGDQVIVSDGAWGEACQWLLNPDGSAASDRVQQLLPLAGGRYAWLEMDGIEYYSAELGAIQRSWDYSGMRYGLMNARGEKLTPAAYREIRTLGADRLLLLTDEEAILADLDGMPLISWRSAGTAASNGEAGASAPGQS